MTRAAPPDTGRMGRLASLLAFVFALGLVLAGSGCGQRFDDLGARNAPAPADLAADALKALEDAGSAHVVVEAKSSAYAGASDFELGLHFEGDVARNAVVGDGEITFPGATLGARLLLGEHDVYIRFMGTWYHGETGIADAYSTAEEHAQELLESLTTVTGLRSNFGELVEGEVTAGPEIDGFETWKFDGHFRADAFAELTEKYDRVKLTEHDRALLDRVAAAMHIVIVAGRDDHLPRQIRFSITPPVGLRFDADSLQGGNSATMSVTIELSRYGTDVSFDAPQDVRPLDELAGRIFGGFE